MKTLNILFISMLLLMNNAAYTQSKTGKLQGRIIDKLTNEELPAVNVILKNGIGEIVTRTSSGFEGCYIIDSIPEGIYQVQTSLTGYSTITMENVRIIPGTTTPLDFKLLQNSTELEEIVILYERPLIDKTKSSSVVMAEEIVSMAVRDITSVSAQAAGVTQNTRIRGSRSEETVYFIDGVKVRGAVNIPQAAIAQTEVISGGLPAKYENYESIRKNDSFQISRPEKETAPVQIPLTYRRESYSPILEIPFHAVSVAPLSTFSSDVDVASYSNIRRFLTNGILPPPDAVRIEEMINYFKYDYLQPDEGEIFSMTSELGKCPWNKDHNLLRIGIKTEDVDESHLPDNNLVFLIDVSGSMSSEDKLPLLKRSLKMLIKKLDDKDRMAIVVYAGAAGIVLKPTKGSDRDEILEAIERLSSGGSTAGGAGIKLAYKLAEENFRVNANNRVILATDGDFNVGISSDDAMIKLIEKKRESGIFLTVLGFGTGNLQDAKMEKIADHGNGNYAYIDNLMEARKVLIHEMNSTLHTVAKDTKFQIEFNPMQVKAYRLIGYENRILRDKDFNDDTKDAGDMGSGHSVTAVYEIIPVSSAEELPLPSVDPLKYQVKTFANAAAQSKEMATLKIRYKKPDEDISTLRILAISCVPSENPSEDFQFTTAIMETGMLLRNSEYKGESSYEDALALAKAGKGNDEYGYRGEFIRLIELAKDMDISKTVGVR